MILSSFLLFYPHILGGFIDASFEEHLSKEEWRSRIFTEVWCETVFPSVYDQHSYGVRNWKIQYYSTETPHGSGASVACFNQESFSAEAFVVFIRAHSILSWLVVDLGLIGEVFHVTALNLNQIKMLTFSPFFFLFFLFDQILSGACTLLYLYINIWCISITFQVNISRYFLCLSL